MATPDHVNVNKLYTQVTALITGFSGSPPAGLTSVGVQGKSYTIPALLTKLTGYQGVLKAVLDAEAAVATAQEGLSEVEGELTSFVQQTRKSVKGTLGNKSASLPSFGLKADKDRQPLTVDQEQEKVAKMRATRAARHTMGAKQKQAIKGQVPASPPASPSPTPQVKPGT